MANQSSSVNLGLSAFPEFQQNKHPELYNDAVHVRNAINLLASYLDTYTGNSGTGTTYFTAGRIAVGNSTGWISYAGFTYNNASGTLSVNKLAGTSILLSDGIGLFGATVKPQAAAYVLTYATASRVVLNATASALATTAATNVAPYGFTTAAQADNIATQVNFLIADVLTLKKLIVALINDTSKTSGVGINAT